MDEAERQREAIAEERRRQKERADDRDAILGAIAGVDEKNEKRGKDLHLRINEQGETYQEKLDKQTKEFTDTVQDIVVDQAELRAMATRNEKDVDKLDGRVDTNTAEIASLKTRANRNGTVRRGRSPDESDRSRSVAEPAPIRHQSSGTLAAEETLTYKLLTSKGFWGGIAGAILLLVLGILKATGTI